MNNNYLNLLAKEILQEVPQGLSKVRFAKILYFVHKGLVQREKNDLDAVRFIRMPLGPVPVGFKELINDKDIQVIETATNPLIYDKQVYKLKDELSISNIRTEAIKKILSLLISFTTSELVTIAHREPTWLNHRNGDEYYLSDQDLVIPLPSKGGKKMDRDLDNQHLQAKLVEGMLNDIVDESTTLEYPEYKN